MKSMPFNLQENGRINMGNRVTDPLEKKYSDTVSLLLSMVKDRGPESHES